MFKTLANAWKIQELRNKILFTIMIILLYRVGTAITVPFVNANVVSYVIGGSSNGIFSLLTTMASGFETASLFALGVQPYITASIVIQLLTVAIPALERLAKQGEEGKKKITVITRYATIAISVLSGVGYYLLLSTTEVSGIHALVYNKWYTAIVIIACFCAGSALVMWMAEKINERGIGNGISIILFANIVSRGVSVAQDFIYKVRLIIDGSNARVFYDQFGLSDYYTPGKWDWTYSVPAILVMLLTTVGILALIWFVIYISDSERRIPVQYAKKVVGRKMYGGRNTNLPLKVNMAGVMPVIFASALLSLPSMIIGFAKPESDSFWGKVASFIAPQTWFYALMTFILILAFAYFYVAISFNPVEVAGNLQQNGGSIPGVRPGKPTSMFIKKVLSRVTFIGALCLSVVAVVPTVVALILNAIGSAANLPGLMATYAMVSEFVQSGTSIIIVVGVVLETVRELEAQMTMRHYKGFLD